MMALIRQNTQTQWILKAQTRNCETWTFRYRIKKMNAPDDLNTYHEGNTMEKVTRTFSASLSEETIEVQVKGEVTDIITRQIITDTSTSEVVSNQTIRTSMPTADALAIIESYVKAG